MYNADVQEGWELLVSMFLSSATNLVTNEFVNQRSFKICWGGSTAPLPVLVSLSMVSRSKLIANNWWVTKRYHLPKKNIWACFLSSAFSPYWVKITNIVGQMPYAIRDDSVVSDWGKRSNKPVTTSSIKLGTARKCANESLNPTAASACDWGE